MGMLELSTASEKDMDFLYELRNEEEVRKNSFQSEIIPYEQHAMWFKRKLLDPATKIYILRLDHERIGQVRLDIASGTGEISYAIAKTARGNGYAKWMLRELESITVRDEICDQFIANVKLDNIVSKKIFSTLGYTENKAGNYYKKIRIS